MWYDSLVAWFLGPVGTISEPSEGPEPPVAVSQPIPGPIVAPAASQTPLQPPPEAVSALILSANNALGFTNGVLPLKNEGGCINRIDPPTAFGIAETVIAAAQGGLTVPYLLACIGIESVFDPLCENGNYSYLGHTGSNPDRLPEGFDVGIAQLKLKYLMEDRNLNVSDAAVFAKDYTKAIPYMATTMKLLLGYADALIQDDTKSVISAFKNRYVVATMAYNFGRSGAKALMASATILPSHCVAVMKNEKAYAQKLNLPSVF